MSGVQLNQGGQLDIKCFKNCEQKEIKTLKNLDFCPEVARNGLSSLHVKIVKLTATIFCKNQMSETDKIQVFRYWTKIPTQNFICKFSQISKYKPFFGYKCSENDALDY